MEVSKYVKINEVNDFCFVVVSFKQEKYVFGHLESIKYLIEEYGDNKKIQLIFSDDSSTDNTVSFAKQWIELNKTLFNEYEVIEHPSNVGTIRNMIDSINCVNATTFKLLSCDDLYYKNNIFEQSSFNEVIFTPAIHFFGNGEIVRDMNISYKRMFLANHAGKAKKTIRKMLQYNNCIEAPGAFVPLKIWRDDNFQSFLKQYKYIEDILEWHYIFNHLYDQISVKIIDRPYVLYRRNVGVSTSIKRKCSPIDNEYKQIRQSIPAKQDLFPKYVNFYRYINFLNEKYCKYIFDNKSHYKEIRDRWENEMKDVNNHLRRIEEAAKESYERVIVK